MTLRGGRSLDGVVDLGAVDLLARLALAARRRGLDLRVRQAPRDLCDLIDLCGLREPLGKPEQREERPRVEEEGQLGDAPV
jgi:hypothetical protein